MNKLSVAVLMFAVCRTVAAVLEPTALNDAGHASVRMPLKLSIFSSHVEDIAMQESVPFAEAAAKVRAAGISGITVMDGLAADRIAAARNAGLAVACVVGWPEFEKGYDEAKCEALVSLAVSNGCHQVMLVPGFYPSAAEDAALFGVIVRRTRRFAAMAATRGVETLVEDFDDERSPTCGIRRTKAFLEAAPSVGFVYDTGNFNSPGERAESGLELLADSLRRARRRLRRVVYHRALRRNKYARVRRGLSVVSPRALASLKTALRDFGVRILRRSKILWYNANTFSSKKCMFKQVGGR